MKKLLFAIALFCALSATAQTTSDQRATTADKVEAPTPSQKIKPERQVSSVEGEVGAGLILGTNKLGFAKMKAGWVIEGEVRYNFRKLPIDVGIHGSRSEFYRIAADNAESTFKNLNFLAVADYNFRRTKNISFFAGIGLGVSSQLSSKQSTDNADPKAAVITVDQGKTAFCFMPRVGVEFFHRVRLTIDYKFQEYTNRNFGISLGFVIGGGKKK